MGRNWLLKIFALGIAIFLWAQHELMKEQTTFFRVPVKLRDIPENMILVRLNQEVIPIEIEGMGYDLFKLKIQQLFRQDYSSLQSPTGNAAYISIDAKKFSEGSNNIRITQEHLILPEKMRQELHAEKIRYELDEWVEVDLDRVITMLKPVEVVFEDVEDQSFFNEKNMILNPSRIEVKGPKTLLKSIDRIRTYPLSRKMVKDYIATVNLDNPDPSVQLLNDKVKIDISTAQYITVTIPLIPIFNSRSSEFTIMPQKVSTLVRGRKDMLNDLNAEDLNPYVNLDRAESGDEVKIEFNPPDDVKILEFTPPKVQVRAIE